MKLGARVAPDSLILSTQAAEIVSGGLWRVRPQGCATELLRRLGRHSGSARPCAAISACELVVIFLVGIKQMAQMPFAEYNNMVKTIPSDRTDKPRILFASGTLVKNGRSRMPIARSCCMTTSPRHNPDRERDIAAPVASRRLRPGAGQPATGNSPSKAHQINLAPSNINQLDH